MGQLKSTDYRQPALTPSWTVCSLQAGRLLRIGKARDCLLLLRALGASCAARPVEFRFGNLGPLSKPVPQPMVLQTTAAQAGS